MARTIPFLLVALAGQFLIMGAPARAEPPSLDLPVACTPGSDCFVQNYVDAEPGEGVRDYACGSQTYDGHDGTDIRIRTTADVERHVTVLAAAPGTVIASRDDMPDRLLRNEADRKAVADRECGNGVLIDHGDGWQTQYCHMRQGSIAVRNGETLTRGARLGDVGYSGMAGFPHLHITLRHGGKAIDPFTGKVPAAGACDDAGKSLWSTRAAAALAYRAGAILQAGFSSAPPDLPAIEEGRTAEASPQAAWPAMVAWGWAINLEAGDEVVVTLEGPAGRLAQNGKAIDRHKAQYMLYSGVRRPAEGWMSGQYVVTITVMRDGKAALALRHEASID